MFQLERRMGGLSAAIPIALFGSGSAVAQPDLESWSDMRRTVVDAVQLMASDVSNGVTPMGVVTDLVLTPDGTEVEYILYEVPYPYRLWGADDGFVAFGESSLERGMGIDLEVRIDPERSSRSPEDLDLSAEQVEERLVSRLLDEPVRFQNGEARELQNILIDRATGTLTHFVIEADPDAVFRAERRAVPADQVAIEEGGDMTASLPVDALEGTQDFDPELL